MGITNSRKVVAVDKRGAQLNRENSVSVFSCGDKSSQPGSSATLWRKEGYHTVDHRESQLLPQDEEDVSDHIELLMVLDSPVGQRHLGAYAKEIKSHLALFFWTDVVDFQSIPAIDYRYSKAKQIFGKYLKRGAVQSLSFISAAKAEEVGRVLAAKESRTNIDRDIFCELQKECFQELFENTFMKFKATEERYNDYLNDMHSIYNVIHTDDFTYLEKLGEGAFGRVVHVMKKSTGRHFAMKIQAKAGLMHNLRDDPTKLYTEKNVFAACRHPFILEMAYAFQTRLHVVLVLNLVTSGNLQDAINEAVDGRLDDARVQLYTAEIVVALLHLHDLGLMYRDLKPRNVMMCEDGHIQLADMGGVGDFRGEVSKTHATNHLTFRGRRNSIRRSSIMGTKGYMAPEMAKMMGMPLDKRVGYTKAVDWWSLGVTVYKMATGKRPFDPVPEKKMSGALTGLNNPLKKKISEYERLKGSVPYPSYLAPATKKFINECLEHNETLRLGSGQDGKARLLEHVFFDGIAWDQVRGKLVTPPYVPVSRPLNEVAVFEDFDSMLDIFQEEDRRKGKDKSQAQQELTPMQQRLFRHWHYVNPTTLKMEMGIANEMEALESSYKLQQLTGGQVEKPKSTTLRTNFRSLSRAFTGGGGEPSLLDTHMPHTSFGRATSGSRITS